MAAITADLVKELRERTGLGMMECKKALVETQGDIEKAVEALRKSGLAKADKRAGKVAADGMIVILTGEDSQSVVMVEVNSETDFVAKGDDFKAFANQVAQCALQNKIDVVETLQTMPIAGAGSATIESTRQALVAKVGENISLRRILLWTGCQGKVSAYSHGVRIGVVVEMQGGEAALGKDVAMHIAASRPVCVDRDGVPQEMVDKEREIFSAQAKESGKPANIIEKMVEGRIAKFFGEVTLLGQPFVKNPDQSVGDLVKAANAKVLRFVRFEVGEGIEKKQGDFAAEVMAQVQQTA